MRRRRGQSVEPRGDRGRAPVASEPMLVTLEKPVYGGASLARVEGKAVFVPLTLPGETARVRAIEDKGGYATAEAEAIVAAAAERVTPGCRHYGVCGGCHYQHASYAAQLAMKQAVLRETLTRAGVPVPDEIAVLAGTAEQAWGYRNRIRVALDGGGKPGYRGRRSHAVVAIEECPIAAPVLVEAAFAAAEIAREAALGLSEIALFANHDASELLVSLFTAGAVRAGFDEVCDALARRVPALTGAELATAGTAGQPHRRLAAWGAESLTYRAAGFDYRVDHGAFFQVNRWLVDALAERVTRGQSGRLAWDLFAGVGLFARRLAGSFERVTAVESAPAATGALAANLRGTTGRAVGVATLDFLRRPRKVAEQPDLIVPDLIVVDPPRTGLGAEITALLAKAGAARLVYVSCDPATLGRDLRALAGSGYGIEAITLADLFPQTFHVETVVELRRG